MGNDVNSKEILKTEAGELENGNESVDNRKSQSKSLSGLSPAQRRARARRKLKGAEKRIVTHEARRDYYRDIISRREIVKIDKADNRVVIQLTELDVEEYRAKKLMEEAHLMKAKNDRNTYRQECDALLNMNNSTLRQTLQNARSSEHARRLGPKTSERVLDAIKDAKGYTELLKAARGKRKIFRIKLWDLLVKANSYLSQELEEKPKLFTKVVDILQGRLQETKLKGE